MRLINNCELLCFLIKTDQAKRKRFSPVTPIFVLPVCSSSALSISNPTNSESKKQAKFERSRDRDCDRAMLSATLLRWMRRWRGLARFYAPDPSAAATSSSAKMASRISHSQESIASIANFSLFFLCEYGILIEWVLTRFNLGSFSLYCVWVRGIFEELMILGLKFRLLI